MGVALERMGRQAEAKHVYRNVMKAFPNDNRGLTSLTVLLQVRSSKKQYSKDGWHPVGWLRLLQVLLFLGYSQTGRAGKKERG